MLWTDAEWWKMEVWHHTGLVLVSFFHFPMCRIGPDRCFKSHTIPHRSGFQTGPDLSSAHVCAMLMLCSVLFGIVWCVPLCKIDYPTSIKSLLRSVSFSLIHNIISQIFSADTQLIWIKFIYFKNKNFITEENSDENYLIRIACQTSLRAVKIFKILFESPYLSLQLKLLVWLRLLA